MRVDQFLLAMLQSRRLGVFLTRDFKHLINIKSYKTKTSKNTENQLKFF